MRTNGIKVNIAANFDALFNCNTISHNLKMHYIDSNSLVFVYKYIKRFGALCLWFWKITRALLSFQFSSPVLICDLIKRIAHRTQYIHIHQIRSRLMFLRNFCEKKIALTRLKHQRAFTFFFSLVDFHDSHFRWLCYSTVLSQRQHNCIASFILSSKCTQNRKLQSKEI